MKQVKAINALEIVDDKEQSYVPADEDMNISTEVEGVQVNTLLDTGSELSGVSLELFFELTENPGIDPTRYFPDELGACGITGSAVDSFGYVNLEVKIGPNTFRANFWIIRMNPRLLIGRLTKIAENYHRLM